MKTIQIEGKDIETLRELIKELDSYYDGRAWTFDDVDNQRQIAVEIADIIRDRV
jgi:hypothetical protein